MLNGVTLARVLPFAVFISLMMVESAMEWLAPEFSKANEFLTYPLRVAITSAVLVWLWIFRRKYWPTWKGLPASSVVLAVAVGIAVIVFWIIVGPYFRTGTPNAANPIPLDPLLGPLWLMTRFLGAVLLVPVIEELFWRSYLARRVDVDEVDKLKPQDMSWKSIFLTSIVFGLGHSEVLAGAVTGVAFCWLYKRRGDLREAVLAHAVANALLFVYVVKYSAFEFWG
jgi:uncharacterized protein